MNRQDFTNDPNGLDNDQLDARLRKLRPDPPPNDLRDRCLPNDDVLEIAPIDSLKEVYKMRRRIRNGAGGLAVAAALVLAFLWGWPGVSGDSTASAAVLQAALSALDEIEAAHWIVTWDSGPGTEVERTAEYWVVRDLGSRMQTDQHTSVYSVKQGKAWSYSKKNHRITDRPQRDLVGVRRYLQQFELDRNLELLRLQSVEEGANVRDERIERDGRKLRRFSGIDKNGRSIVVELDPAARRIVMTESWTFVTAERTPTRIAIRLDYPTADSLSGLFVIPQVEGAEVRSTPDRQSAGLQCQINLRNLYALIVQYQEQHDGLLPQSLEKLAPYAPDEDVAPLCKCRLPDSDEVAAVAYRAKALGVTRYEELNHTVVILECPFPGGSYQAYGDGHVAFVKSDE